MPFTSKAQMRKFALLVKQGKMAQSVFDEWMRATPDTQKLPERIHHQHPERPKTMKIGKVKVIK